MKSFKQPTWVQIPVRTNVFPNSCANFSCTVLYICSIKVFLILKKNSINNNNNSNICSRFSLLCGKGKHRVENCTKSCEAINNASEAPDPL